MRPVAYSVLRVVVVVSLTSMLSVSLAAAPRDRAPREKQNPIVKVIKKIVRSLGDGLIVPTP